MKKGPSTLLGIAMEQSSMPSDTQFWHQTGQNIYNAKVYLLQSMYQKAPRVTNKKSITISQTYVNIINQFQIEIPITTNSYIQNKQDF